MKKILNDPKNYVDEALEGIYAAYGDKVSFFENDKRVLIRAGEKKTGKVGIVTGGGFGHLPLFLGYVGQGMLDACAVGNVFASPSYTKMEAAIRAANAGAGVLCLYGNYGGDKMNFRQAMEDCEELEDIRCAELLGTDDIASAPAEAADTRRGVAGIVYAYKIAGAAAEEMRSLDEVVRVTQKALQNIRTMGVALTPCVLPEVGKPTFSINEGEMEIGMGIHGETGISKSKVLTADETADMILEKIGRELDLSAGKEVSVMVNGLGATSIEEQMIVYRRIARIMKEKQIAVIAPHIGEYATSMEMAGLSVTVFVLDEELKKLLLAPASTPFYRA
ncbi:MAG: dihydroxyacetone kinase subunit DhaK [Marvinbryantia sp.]|uniref:dihydroxyacetone kinase subunit DhaK n=1 Tax=Marvinbryantia sp. TaxID=2496532 RepID=UPI0025EDBB60|nr:dihydroxyacetone kinase subunit DhaK [uncultured Marvinbryantia sp.]